jgi:SAM-dependent methyltransferase
MGQSRQFQTNVHLVLGADKDVSDPMIPYTLVERATFYHAAFPKFPPLRADDRWLDGMWFLGQNYRGSGQIYGSYPPQYLRRVMALFPDFESGLHLFSGSLPPQDKFVRFDNLRGDVNGDAERLSSYFDLSGGPLFDLILADPPYSEEDCNHYGTPMVNRNTVLRECARVLRPDGFVVWLDQVLPMFKKTELHLCGAIGLVRSTNHRFRIVTIFRRVG